jgi:aspartyl/asparaginyl beta-hydroxylase (cupin superfamily)
MQTGSPDKSQQPWINFLNKERVCSSKETFYEADKLEWTKSIETQWDLLRDDILNFLDNNSHELKSFYKNQQQWKSFGLYAWGMSLSDERCRKCKTTVDILRQIPGVVTIMVGVMEPFSKIEGHHGDTDAIYRCHLPLIVPAGLPDVGFQVEEEKRSWVEGKFMIFNDAKFHQAWNNSPHRRVVLIVDVMKPEYGNRTVEICSKVLSGLAMQKAAQKASWIKHTPLPVLRMIHPVLSRMIALNLKYKKGTSRSLL